MVRGSCPVCHPSWVVTLVLQNLLGVFVEPLRTYELRCPASGCALHPRLCLGWASWVFPCYLFSWLFPDARLWCPLLSSRVFVTNFQAPPLLLGLRALLYRPNQRETIAMGECYILCGRSRIPGPLWFRIVSDASGSLFAARCNRRELSKTTVSWLWMPLSRESCLSATERSVSCPLSSVLSCYRSVSSL